MPDSSDIANRVSRLLDNLLEASEQQQILDEAETDAELAAQIAHQRRFDESLLRNHSPPDSLKPLSVVLQERADEVTVAPITQRITRRKVVSYAIAASLAWLVVAGQLLWPESKVEVAFRERPLTELYRECVEDGFEPYWVCDDEVLFAATFEKRQGVPLKLVDLPEGCRMEGLAYLAGLSLDSTSLLARIDGEPVIVFVERAEKDRDPKAVKSDEQKGLRVIRTEKYGLVFYEVSPNNRLRVTDFLEITDVLSSVEK